MFYNETFCVFFKHCESVGRRLDQIVDQKCADNWRIGHRSMQSASREGLPKTWGAEANAAANGRYSNRGSISGLAIISSLNKALERHAGDRTTTTTFVVCTCYKDGSLLSLSTVTTTVHKRCWSRQNNMIAHQILSSCASWGILAFFSIFKIPP